MSGRFVSPETMMSISSPILTDNHQYIPDICQFWYTIAYLGLKSTPKRA